jgi:hypothetical protein
MTKIDEFYSDRSFLVGQPTKFKNITCRGAKFDGIKNTTNARMPSDRELREDAPRPTTSLAGKVFGFLRS